MLAKRLAAIVLVAVVSACNDLGPCDSEAARELVYGRGDLVATKGQALMHDSCGQGAFCHSAGASGRARRGAPKGMDFDMLPRAKGLGDVLKHREAIWETVREGTMPPAGFAVGDGDWTFSAFRSDDEARLPPLSTEVGKAAFRNWLACGAPVVVETSVPDWAKPPIGGAVSSWTELHRDVIVPRCAFSGCHDSRSAGIAGELDLSDVCGARRALLESGPCGAPRVKPGDAASLLIDKVENAAPRCADPMPPPSGGLRAAEIASLRAWIEEGARAEDCE